MCARRMVIVTPINFKGLDMTVYMKIVCIGPSDIYNTNPPKTILFRLSSGYVVSRANTMCLCAGITENDHLGPGSNPY